MTINRARQLLGINVIKFSDKEIGDLIVSVGGVCDAILDVIVTDIESTKKTRLTTPKYLTNNGSN